MNCNQCDFTACSFIGIFVSIVFGVITGVLFAFGFIPNIVISTWIAFGIGVLSLIFLVIGILTNTANPSIALTKCLRNNTICLLIGIFGTIIFALIDLSIVLTPTLIVIIILVAIEAFFFAFLIIGIIALLTCIVCNMRSLRQD